MLPPEVVAYYERGAEQDRLTARVGRVEWARTWDLLERFLPDPPATILDVGGGPGAYAVPLALAGQAVHLVDAMPLHVRQAREAAAAAEVGLASAEVGDARELAFPDAGADAVLLLGPLYHLPEPADRHAALTEARRVLRPGGVLLAAGISRFASFFEGVHSGWAGDHPEIVESGLHTGTHRNPRPGGPRVHHRTLLPARGAGRRGYRGRLRADRGGRDRGGGRPGAGPGRLAGRPAAPGLAAAGAAPGRGRAVPARRQPPPHGGRPPPVSRHPDLAPELIFAPPRRLKHAWPG